MWYSCAAEQSALKCLATLQLDAPQNRDCTLVNALSCLDSSHAHASQRSTSSKTKKLMSNLGYLVAHKRYTPPPSAVYTIPLSKALEST